MSVLDHPIKANTLWKYYQNKNNSKTTSTPAHLILTPSDNNKILNSHSFFAAGPLLISTFRILFQCVRFLFHRFRFLFPRFRFDFISTDGFRLSLKYEQFENNAREREAKKETKPGNTKHKQISVATLPFACGAQTHSLSS